MNTQKHVRLRFGWLNWPKGHVFTAMPAAQAEVMVKMGRAEYVAQPTASPMDRMMRPLQRASHRGAQAVSKE